MRNSALAYQPGRGFRWIYVLSLIALAFSGFGQMPIFKRYYLADLPGMAWAGDYHVTLVIHYVAAAVFLLIAAYYLVLRGMTGNFRSLGGRGWGRGLLLGALVLTGVVLVLRNLPGFVLPPGLIIAATLVHVAATMLFLISAATWFRFGKRK